MRGSLIHQREPVGGNLRAPNDHIVLHGQNPRGKATRVRPGLPGWTHNHSVMGWTVAWPLKARFPRVAACQAGMPPPLYDLASERRELDTVVDQMEALGRLIDQSQPFRRLLTSPLVDVTQARTAVSAVLSGQGFGKTVDDFVGVVANNRRLERAARHRHRVLHPGGAEARRGDRQRRLRPPPQRRAARTAPRPPDRGRVWQRQHPGVRWTRRCSAGSSCAWGPGCTIRV